MRLDIFLPTRVSFPADVWEEVMGYRCQDACGLAAATVAKVSGGALGGGGGGLGRRASSWSDSDVDDDLDAIGDVEMGEFYSGMCGGLNRSAVGLVVLVGLGLVAAWCHDCCSCTCCFCWHWR